MREFKLRCPKDSGHKRFQVIVRQARDWLVDENGTFIEDRGAVEEDYAEFEPYVHCAECGTDCELNPPLPPEN